MKKIIIIMLAFVTACCGSQEKKPVYKTGDIVSTTGIVSMAGNEPFTRMVVRSSEGKGSFFLPKEFKKDRKNLIGKTVTVKGKIEAFDLKSADGKYTVHEYHLTPDVIEEKK